MLVCVCVCERERESEREGVQETNLLFHCMHVEFSSSTPKIIVRIMISLAIIIPYYYGVELMFYILIHTFHIC